MTLRIGSMLLLLLTVVAATSCRRGTGPAPQPATRPEPAPAGDWLSATTQGDDWPAFQRGGAMRGVGAPVAAPPMRVLWTYQVGKDHIPGGPVIAGRRVFVADDEGVIHCIDLANGRRVWTRTSQDKSGFYATPLVVGGRVFIGDAGGMFYCLSADTGEVLWQYDSGAPIHSGANVTPDGHIVFAGGDTSGGGAGQLVCLSPASSQPDWTVSIAPTNGGVAVSGPAGWISSCDRSLRQVDLKNGETINRTGLDLESGSTPVVCDGAVLVGTFDGVLTCLDPASGDARWKFEPDGQAGNSTAPPACDGGVVVVTDRGSTIYGLDLATSKRKWTYTARDDVTAPPAISSGRVYVGSVDGRFYVLDLLTGKPLWTYQTNQEIRAPAAIGRGAVVFCDSSGAIRCLVPNR